MRILIPQPKGKNFEGFCPSDQEPCLICRRPIKNLERAEWFEISTKGEIIFHENGAPDSQGMFPVGPECKKLVHEAHMNAIHEEVALIVQTEKCPICGSGLRRNISMAGWWQCEQYGSDQFRARPQDPPCPWQGFTE